MNWYLLYTRSRFERVVEEQVIKAGYEAWVPLVNQLKQWSDRKKLVSEPLFRSYCLVRCGVKEVSKLATLPGAVRPVYFNGKPATLRDEEVDQIREILKLQHYKEITVTSLEPGDLIRMKKGVFSDRIAQVDSVDGKQQTLTLILEESGFMLRIKLNTDAYEKVDH